MSDSDTAAMKAFFDEHGYYVARGALSAAEVRECAAAIHELHERAAAGEQPEDFQWEPFLADGALTADALPVLRKIEKTGDLSATFHRLAEHPALLRHWQTFIGDEDLLLFRSTLMLKPAHHGSAHALHQVSDRSLGAHADSLTPERHCRTAPTGRCAPPARPSRSASPSAMPTRPTGVSVSLTRSHLRAPRLLKRFVRPGVIPGSHKWGLKYWGDITRAPGEDIVTPMSPSDAATKRLAGIDAGGIDEGDPTQSPTAEMLATQIEVPLKSGDALFFHSLTAHGSDPNTSPNPRHTALFAAFSPRAEYVPTEGGAPSATYRVIAGLGGAPAHTMRAEGADASAVADGEIRTVTGETLQVGKL